MNLSFPIVALVGETADLKPAEDLLAGFGIDFAEKSLSEAVSCRCRVMLVASADGFVPTELAAKTAALVIRIPIGNIVMELLMSSQAWPESKGAPFATVAIGESGARNAALLAVSILALNDDRLHKAWIAFRQEQTASVLRQPPPGDR